MTMRYAATLASTAEREFPAMVKIGRDGRQVGMDRRDMLDILQLDRRTDRILPNGYCLLPPVRSCDKGNLPRLQALRDRPQPPPRDPPPARRHRAAHPPGTARRPLRRTR